jgi:microcystin-dependent protein
MRLKTLLLSIALLVTTSYSGRAQQKMPVGTVFAYAGEFSNIPNNCLICDGTEYNSADYPELYKAIKIAWGGNIAKKIFAVPDLRGAFLRGVNAGQSAERGDPQASARVAIHLDPENHLSGNTGNSVGSYQADALRSHHHDYTIPVRGAQSYATSGSPTNPFIGGDSTPTTTDTGGLETRPKNAYVYYLIVAK